MTYFVRQQLRCIEQEIKHLARFLETRVKFAQWLESKQALTSNLNARQLALIQSALKNPQATFTVTLHLQYHGVSQPTAWKDLKGLAAEGLLEVSKVGKKSIYRPSNKLARLAADRPRGT